MYSLMLMTAMATAPETPEFHGFFRRLFSLGDSGSCCGGSGRSAGAATSCTGSGCGGYDNGKMRAFTRDDPSGSCNGRTSAGASSCTGSRSASPASGCCGGSSYIPRGATPDPFGSPPMPGSSGPFAVPSPAIPSASYFVPGPVYTYPTYSTYASPGPPAAGCYGVPPSDPPLSQPAPQPARPITPPPFVPESRSRMTLAAGNDGRATVVVRLPADAKLYAEGRPLLLTGETRQFVTPPLPAGDYSYAFRVEYVRNGETITQARSLSVRPGGTYPVEFADLVAARPAPTAPQPTPAVPSVTPNAGTGPTQLAAKPAPLPLVPDPKPAPTRAPERARITVKLPPGGVLYVDGKRNERTELVRQFDTPPLPTGEEYAYVMKVELKQGAEQPQYQTTKLTFRAGEITSVDFTYWPRVPETPGAVRAGR